MSDGTNGDNVERKTGNIEDLVKSNKISDTISTTALDWKRSTFGNGNKGMRGGMVIGVRNSQSYERKPLNQ